MTYEFLTSPEALAAKPRPGAKPIIPAELVDQMVALREAGFGYHTIAARLNEAGVPTTRGGAAWYAGTVQRALKSRGLI